MIKWFTQNEQQNKWFATARKKTAVTAKNNNIPLYFFLGLPISCGIFIFMFNLVYLCKISFSFGCLLLFKPPQVPVERFIHESGWWKTEKKAIGKTNTKSDQMEMMVAENSHFCSNDSKKSHFIWMSLHSMTTVLWYAAWVNSQSIYTMRFQLVHLLLTINKLKVTILFQCKCAKDLACEQMSRNVDWAHQTLFQ